MADAAATSQILVLAGTNGAGKSSIGGEWLRQNGGQYFNPDEAAKRILECGLSLDEANSLAWHEGKRLLEEAIQNRNNFAFETTLGGNTITGLLAQAATKGLHLKIWYSGLDSPERHIQRVKARVERGGHDIPEDKIRERYEGSRENLARLIPVLAELQVYDNSVEADPAAGQPPRPVLLLHMRDGLILKPDLATLKATPAWARPIASAAMKHHLSLVG